MAARIGCTYLIHRLRVMVDDQDTETWDNDELQDILDDHREFVGREELTWVVAQNTGGTPQYTEAFSRHGWYEQTTGGTARFIVEDTGGTVQGTANWTANYIQGQLTFGANQEGSARYLTGYTYNLHRAAADCWRDKAAITSAYYAFRSGNAQISREQWFDHCMRMVEMHNALSPATVVEMVTDDDF